MFDCDECGKNSVDRLGEWCGECQEKAHFEYLEGEAEWFSRSRLCQKCCHSDGPDPSDRCVWYRMPLYMVARKNKCKHFREIDYSEETLDWVW